LEASATTQMTRLADLEPLIEARSKARSDQRNRQNLRGCPSTPRPAKPVAGEGNSNGVAMGGARQEEQVAIETKLETDLLSLDWRTDSFGNWQSDRQCARRRARCRGTAHPHRDARRRRHGIVAVTIMAGRFRSHSRSDIRTFSPPSKWARARAGLVITIRSCVNMAARSTSTIHGRRARFTVRLRATRQMSAEIE